MFINFHAIVDNYSFQCSDIYLELIGLEYLLIISWLIGQICFVCFCIDSKQYAHQETRFSFTEFNEARKVSQTKTVGIYF